MSVLMTKSECLNEIRNPKSEIRNPSADELQSADRTIPAAPGTTPTPQQQAAIDAKRRFGRAVGGGGVRQDVGVDAAVSVAPGTGRRDVPRCRVSWRSRLPNARPGRCANEFAPSAWRRLRRAGRRGGTLAGDRPRARLGPDQHDSLVLLVAAAVACRRGGDRPEIRSARRDARSLVSAAVGRSPGCTNCWPPMMPMWRNWCSNSG